MKKYLVLAASALALAGCSSDDFVGDSNGNVKNSNAAINFSSETGAITRASSTNGSTSGTDAATALGNNFVVVGYKTNDNSTTTVFDHYNVNYIDATNGSTVTNTTGWEYVGQSMDVNGVTGDNKKLAKTAQEQTIKYWDYSAASYNFLAFSMGNGHATTTGEGDNTTSTPTYATPTAVNIDKLTTAAYTLKGDAETLGECYISDIQTVQKANYKDGAVQMQFRHLTSKVRIALYETIPGYVVSDVKFHTSATDSDQKGNGQLYGLFNEKGTYTVYFSNNNAHVKFTKTKDANDESKDADDATSLVKDFGTVNYNNQAENQIEAEKNYLSQSKSAPSYCGGKDPYYQTVLPAEDASQIATIRIDYKLTATDGSEEVINVKNATATIPEAYTKWKPGYAYTYIFKISESTNGSTGETSDPSGLTAISFDAVVYNDEATGQETVTTVSDPSITTYGFNAKTKEVEVNGNEYTAGTDIYATVYIPESLVPGTQEGQTSSSFPAKTVAPQKLYTISIEDNSVQTINEASVANAIVNGGKADINGKTLTATLVSTGTESVTTVPTGDDSTLNVNALKWTGTANTIYAVEYECNDPNYSKYNNQKYYKIVIVK